MKLLTMIILLLSFLNMNKTPSKHGDETPHGGIIAHANDGYSIEKVQGIKRLFFYLLDNDEKTTIEDKNLSGFVEFTLKDGSKERHQLELTKNLQALKIIFTEKIKIDTVVVYILYKEKIITAKFN